MLFLTVYFCWLACAYGAPASTDVLPLERQQPTVIPIVSQSEEFESNGSYKFSYETGNGIKREESSYSKQVPRGGARAADSDEGGESDSDEIHVQVGSYSYTAPDGTVISVRYIADENGFQPIGDHIPGLPKTVISNEKLGRTLKSEDNAKAESTPAFKSAPQLESRSAVVEDEKSNEDTRKKTNDLPKIESTTGVTKTPKDELTVSSSKNNTTVKAKGGKSDVSTNESKTTGESSEKPTTQGLNATTASDLPKSTQVTSSEISTMTEGTSETLKTTEVPTTMPAIVVV